MTSAVMGDATGGPIKGPVKKKKKLAFLKSTPKPLALDDFDSNNDGGSKDKDEVEDDGLDMFRRSKDFWPQLIKKDTDSPRETTPAPKTETHKHTTEESDEEPMPSSSRKRRKMASPQPVDTWKSETYNDLYGPPTPPRRDSKQINQSSPALVHPGEETPTSIGKSKYKGKGKETLNLVKSDLSSPISRDNSRRLPADVVALDANNAVDDDGEDQTTPRKNPKIEPPSISKRSASPILLEDSDDELLDAVSKPETDEFAHFIEQARKRNEDIAKAAAAAAAADSSDTSSDNEAEPTTEKATRPRRKKNVPFISVKVFVLLRIAGLKNGPKPFGCVRRVDQSLLKVRTSFVQHLRRSGNDISEELENEIFLTWRHLRLFDSSSITGLPVETADQKLVVPDRRTEGYTSGGLLFEAWTTEDHERHKADEERKRRIDRGELPEEGGGVDTEDDDVEVLKPEVAKVRLSLQEKDKDAVRMTAYVDTQIKVLIGAYRKRQSVPNDRDIKILYEGDWLTPGMTVEEADIEDMCTLEVYLK